MIVWLVVSKGGVKVCSVLVQRWIRHCKNLVVVLKGYAPANDLLCVCMGGHMYIDTEREKTGQRVFDLFLAK